jgi:hypothetical protein
MQAVESFAGRHEFIRNGGVERGKVTAPPPFTHAVSTTCPLPIQNAHVL